MILNKEKKVNLSFELSWTYDFQPSSLLTRFSENLPWTYLKVQKLTLPWEAIPEWQSKYLQSSPNHKGTDKNADIYFFKRQKLDQSRGPLITEKTISSLQVSQA